MFSSIKNTCATLPFRVFAQKYSNSKKQPTEFLRWAEFCWYYLLCVNYKEAQVSLFSAFIVELSPARTEK